jgi:hypothetical protein
MAKKERVKDICAGARARVDALGTAERKRFRKAFLKEIFSRRYGIIEELKNKMEDKKNKNV